MNSNSAHVVTSNKRTKHRPIPDGVASKLPSLPPEDQPDQAALAAAYAMVSIVEEEDTGIMPENTGLSQPQSEPFPEDGLLKYKGDFVYTPDVMLNLSDRDSFKPSQSAAQAPSLDLASPVLERWAGLVQAKILRPEHAQLLEVWDELAQISKFVSKTMLQKDVTAVKVFVETARADMKNGNKKASSLNLASATTLNLDRACKSRCSMLHPSSPKRVCWDFLGAFILFHDLVMIPLQVFENLKSTDGLPGPYVMFEKIFDFVATCYWTVDIMVSFITGYFSDEGFIEMRPRLIAKHYMRTWGPLDFFIVILDWCTIIIGLGSEQASYVRLGKTVSRFVRILRLLRFMKLSSALKGLVARVNSEYLLTMGGLFRLVVLIVIFAHYLACGWFGISQLVSGGWDNWAKRAFERVEKKDSLSYAYSTSLHWSLTQFTPASMEVVPCNPYERFYNCGVIVIALVTFSSFVSSITSAMTHLRAINARQTEQDTLIRRFFAENKVSHEVAARIWRFLKKSRQSLTNRLKERDVPALKSLPEKIRQELRAEVFMPMLSAHPLLKVLNVIDRETIREVCDVAVSEVALKSGEEVFPAGTRPSLMVFVISGQLEYIIEHEEIPIKGGEWVCESSLWASGLKLQGCIVSATACEILFINAEAFQEVTKAHNDLAGFLSSYAQSFVELFNDASQDEHFTNTLLNDKNLIANLAFQACDEFIEKVKIEELVPVDEHPTDLASMLFRAAHSSDMGIERKKLLQRFSMDTSEALSDALRRPSGMPQRKSDAHRTEASAGSVVVAAESSENLAKE